DQRDGVGVALLDEDLDRLADVEGRLAGSPGIDEDRHDPERKPDVADAVDDERLLCRECRRALAIPEADEQVARQADQLPGHEDEKPAVRQDQQKTRRYHTYR